MHTKHWKTSSEMLELYTTSTMIIPRPYWKVMDRPHEEEQHKKYNHRTFLPMGNPAEYSIEDIKNSAKVLMDRNGTDLRAWFEAIEYF